MSMMLPSGTNRIYSPESPAYSSSDGLWFMCSHLSMEIEIIALFVTFEAYCCMPRLMH
jgi:hypothetical protein